jgi:hypothetical protein
MKAGSFGTVSPFARGRRVPRELIREPGGAGLLRWLARTHPKALEQALRAHPDLTSAATLGALGQAGAAAPSRLDRLAQNAQAIAAAVVPFLQLEAQRKVLKLQVQRAAEGKPPLDASAIELPAARVEVEAGSRTRGLLGLALAGAAAAWLFFRRGRGR